MISDNPNVGLGSVDCLLYTRRIALKDDYHKKRMDNLAYTPLEFNYMETLANTFIDPAIHTNSLKKIFSTKLPLVELSLQWIQTLRLQDRTLKIFSGINNLIAKKYSEVVRQLLILMLPIIFAFMLRQWKQWTFKMISPHFEFDIFTEHYVLVFDLTSMQDATEKCHYPEVLENHWGWSWNLLFL